MKKIIYLLFCLLISLASMSQTQVTRTTRANTVADSRLRALLNFYVPTGSAVSLNGGLDSTGALFFKTSDSTLNVRVGNNSSNSWLPLASKTYVDGHVGFSKDSTFQNVRVKAYANVSALRAGTEYINGVTLALTQSYNIQGDGGQGEYRWNGASTSADDSSFHIVPTGRVGTTGCWDLQIRNNQINFLAIGGKSDYSGAHTDNAWTFDKAMNFIANLTNKSSNLYIPWGGDSYYFSRPLYVKGYNTCIIGDRGATNPRTVLIWHNTAFVQCLIQNVQFVCLENLQLRDDVSEWEPTAPYDVDKIGVYLTALFRMKNIFVSGAKGDGIRIYGGTGDAHHPSNVNQWYAEDVTTRNNRGDGWSVYGSDANAGDAHGIFSFLNHRWGIRDNSWLGNNYYGCETAYNGAADSATYTKLTSGGHTYYYYCKQDGTNHAPIAATSSPFWELWATDTDPFSGRATAWNSTTLFYGAGAFTAGFTAYPVLNDSLQSMNAANNLSKFDGTYVEGGYPAPILDGGIVNIGGTQYIPPLYGMNIQGFNGQVFNKQGFFGYNFNVGNAAQLLYDLQQDVVQFASTRNLSLLAPQMTLGSNTQHYRISPAGRHIWTNGASNVDNLPTEGDGVTPYQFTGGSMKITTGHFSITDNDYYPNNILMMFGQHAPNSSSFFPNTSPDWVPGSIIFNSAPTAGSALAWRLLNDGVTWETLTAGGGGGGGAWGTITGTLSSQTDLQTALNTKEDVSNKSTTTTLGTSNTLYPTQNAVKTYVDAAVAGATGVSAPAGQIISGTGTSYTSSPNYYFDNPGWSRLNIHGAAAQIQLAASGGHTWDLSATATGAGFSQANSLALFDENAGAYRFVIDGSGNFLLGAYAGTGNRISYFDNTGTFVRSSIDPANIALLSAAAFTASPTAPTPTAADNSTKVATTAYVDNAVAGVSGSGTESLTLVSTQNFTLPNGNGNYIYEFSTGGGTFTMPSSPTDGQVIWISNTTSGTITFSTNIFESSSTSATTLAATKHAKLIYKTSTSKWYWFLLN